MQQSKKVQAAMDWFMCGKNSKAQVDAGIELCIMGHDTSEVAGRILACHIQQNANKQESKADVESKADIVAKYIFENLDLYNAKITWSSYMPRHLHVIMTRNFSDEKISIAFRIRDDLMVEHHEAVVDYNNIKIYVTDLLKIIQDFIDKNRNKMIIDANTVCTRELQILGKAYPKTCPTCGFGPCKKKY